MYLTDAQARPGCEKRDTAGELLAKCEALAANASKPKRRVYDARKLAADRARADAIEAGRIGAAKAAANAAWLEERIAIYKKDQTK